MSGSKDAVERARKMVSQQIQRFEKESTNVHYKIQQLGTTRGLLDWATTDPEINAPTHWKKFKGSLLNVISQQGHLEKVDRGLKDAVKSLVMRTWKQNLVGQGQDAVNLTHRGIKIKRVRQIESVILYRRYQTKLKEFCLQASHIPKLTDLKETDIETNGRYINYRSPSD